VDTTDQTQGRLLGIGALIARVSQGHGHFAGGEQDNPCRAVGEPLIFNEGQEMEIKVRQPEERLTGDYRDKKGLSRRRWCAMVRRWCLGAEDARIWRCTEVVQGVQTVVLGRCSRTRLFAVPFTG
jgi:hypothetical protein